MIALLTWFSLAGPPCSGPVPAALGDGWRPTLSGPELTVDAESGWFRVHATAEGADAAGVDADADGVPDLVGLAIEALESARLDFEEAGWRPLGRDGGLGGSDAIDVYLMAIDANGYANAIVGAGDQGTSCFIRLDPAIVRLGSRVAASVARHELHHCVQYQYTTESAAWVYEGQATYEQYREVGDPALDLALGVLWALRLGQPERPLDAEGDRFEYAAFLWFKFWEDRGGELPRLWEFFAEEPRWRPALDTASQEVFALSLSALFLEHAVWNTAACARDDGRHYRDDAAPCTALGASVEAAAVVNDEAWSVDLPGVPLTSALATWPAVAGTRPVLRCVVEEGELRAAVADEIGGVTADVVYGPATEVRGSVSRGEVVKVVVASVGTVPARAICRLDREQAPDGGGCAAGAVGPTVGWPIVALMMLGIARLRSRQR